MNQPSDGVKTRAQIDTEVVRGLLLANGGGAVALLAFLRTVFETKALSSLALPVVVALFLFHLGIVVAIIHNYYRRRCSLKYEQHGFQPPAEKFLWLDLSEPKVCFIGKCYMWASIAFFLVGGCVVFVGALCIAVA